MPDPQYDSPTLEAEDRYQQALAEYGAGIGLQGLPGFYQRRSLAALVDARSRGLHRLYRHHVGHPGYYICSCGLTVDENAGDVPRLRGHLDLTPVVPPSASWLGDQPE